LNPKEDEEEAGGFEKEAEVFAETFQRRFWETVCLVVMEDEALASLPRESDLPRNPFVEYLEVSSPMIQVHLQSWSSVLLRGESLGRWLPSDATKPASHR
jgi:hypothetical protein